MLCVAVLLVASVAGAQQEPAAESAPEAAASPPATAPPPAANEEMGPTAVVVVASGGGAVTDEVLTGARQAAVAVVASARQRHHREARAEQDPGLPHRAASCADDACLVTVGLDAQAGYLMVLMIEAAEPGYRVMVLLVDVTNEQMMGSAAFELPADPAAFSTVMTAPLGPLVEAIESPYPTTGTLAITAEQIGAEIIIDGELVGNSPLQPIEEVEPGEHQVQVSMEGYLDDERTVEVVAGEVATVSVTLQPEPPPPPPPPPSTPIWRRWWFWTAIGAVVVGTGLGVGLGVGLSGDAEVREVQEGVQFPSWEPR